MSYGGGGFKVKCPYLWDGLLMVLLGEAGGQYAELKEHGKFGN